MIRCRSADPPTPPATTHPPPHASLQYHNQTRHAGKYPAHSSRPRPAAAAWTHVPPPPGGRAAPLARGARRLLPVCHLPPLPGTVPPCQIAIRGLAGALRPLTPCPPRDAVFPALLSPSFSSFHLDHPPRHRHCRPAALEARASGARRPKPSPSLLLRWLPLAGTADGDSRDRARRSLGVILTPPSWPASGFRRCPPVTPPLAAFPRGALHASASQIPRADPIAGCLKDLCRQPG